MSPFNDVDAVLLLALSVAAKRRPAELAEIVTAIDLAPFAIPTERKLAEASTRLSTAGLIAATDGGYLPTPAALELLASQRKNDDAMQRLARLKPQLAAYRAKEQGVPLTVSPEQWLAAIDACLRIKKEGRTWGVEKPKPVWIPKKDLVSGKRSLPASKRRKK